MISFLIDADNLSAPGWIDDAFQKLAPEGSIAIRRAYGSPENLKGLAETMRLWAIRPFVNLPLTKNSTDMSLAVDAMELACQTPRPRLIVIGSGDSDFVPLVVRLRERGIRVICITEKNKMAAEAIPAYDAVIYVTDNSLPPAPALKPEKKKKTSVATAPANPAPKKAAAKQATTKPAPSKPAAKKAARKVAAPIATVTVEDILAALPELNTGNWIALGNAIKILRDKKMLGKNAASTKFFAKFPAHFELTPAKQPNQLRLIPAPQ